MISDWSPTLPIGVCFRLMWSIWYHSLDPIIQHTVLKVQTSCCKARKTSSLGLHEVKRSSPGFLSLSYNKRQYHRMRFRWTVAYLRGSCKTFTKFFRLKTDFADIWWRCVKLKKKFRSCNFSDLGFSFQKFVFFYSLISKFKIIEVNNRSG